MCGCVHLLEILWRALSRVRAALVLKWVATLVRVRFADVRASNFFEFLSHIMRSLLAVPFGIR